MLSATILVGYYKKLSGTLHMIHMPAHDLLVGGHLGQKGNGILMGSRSCRCCAPTQRRLVAHRSRGDLQRRGQLPSPRVAQRPQDTRDDVVHPGFLLLGVTLLAAWTHAIPYAAGYPTVLGQEVDVVLEEALSATPFITRCYWRRSWSSTRAGTPRSTAFRSRQLRRHRQVPARQLTKRGHRLAFSNGILVLGAVSLTLIIVFDAKVNALVALYAIGVFTGFTMAGAGMVARHCERRPASGVRRGRQRPLGHGDRDRGVVFIFAKFTEARG